MKKKSVILSILFLTVTLTAQDSLMTLIDGDFEFDVDSIPRSAGMIFDEPGLYPPPKLGSSCIFWDPPILIGVSQSAVNRIKLPEHAFHESEEIVLRVSAQINKSGKVIRTRFYNQESQYKDQALSVIESTKWIPGSQRGKKVTVFTGIDLVFEIDSITVRTASEEIGLRRKTPLLKWLLKRF